MAGFLFTALGVHITTPFVYQVLPTYLRRRKRRGCRGPAGFPRRLTLGQWPEIAVLAALPWMLGRWGAKGTLLVGIGAWAVRFGTLAWNPPLWVAVAGIPLHGVGTACFTVAGQVYIDGHAPPDRRASAQALYLVTTAGIGSFLGSVLAGNWSSRFTGNSAMVFLIPCMIDSALIVYFCAGFRPSSTTEECAGVPQAARSFRDDGVRGAIARVASLVTESADG